MTDKTREAWECFCDESYYHKWAVRDKNGDRKFTSAIHVGTKEEAEFLVERLNAYNQRTAEIAELQQKLEVAKRGLERIGNYESAEGYIATTTLIDIYEIGDKDER